MGGVRTRDVVMVRFDKIAGSDFEQGREAALARRAEGRRPGVIPPSPPVNGDELNVRQRQLLPRWGGFEPAIVKVKQFPDSHRH